MLPMQDLVILDLSRVLACPFARMILLELGATVGGLMSLTGEKGRGPVKPGLPMADLTSGLWVAIAILAAPEQRSRARREVQHNIDEIAALVPQRAASR